MTPARIPARLSSGLSRLRPGSANRRLREANDTLMRILGAIDEYIYTGEFHPDGDYRLIVQGPCRAQFLGLPPKEARQAVWADYVHPADRDVFDRAHAEVVQRGALDFQYRMVDAEGTIRWVRDRGRIRREDGRVFLDGSVMDVTAIRQIHGELEQARERADRLARIDPLTGVPNRRLLDDVVERAIDGSGGGLLLIDVDRFKRINDGHGHGAGDTVLVEVARRLTACAHDVDRVVRMGGEEFLIALGGLESEDDLRERAEHVRRTVRDTPFEIAGPSLDVTVSVGAVWIAPHTDPDRNMLLAGADKALYTAKRLGRDRVLLYTDQASSGTLAAEAPEILALAQAVARCVAARHRADAAHSDEVGDLAGRVAARLRCTPETVARARLAGLVHDVGKLEIPDAVLLKPGRLDEAEWELMRGHSEAGESVLRGVPELADLAPVVRHHHERWDGGGYPDGIAGTDIPLEARIVATVDAWSAMTADRVYRAALPRQKALVELRRVAGSQLDPSAVEALCAELAADGPEPLAVPAAQPVSG